LRKISISLLVVLSVAFMSCLTSHAGGSKADDHKKISLVVQVGFAEDVGNGRQMEALIALQNQSNDTIRDLVRPLYRVFEIILHDSHGKVPALTEFGALRISPWANMTSSGSVKTLDAGKIRMWRLDLSRCYELPAGTYQLRLRMRVTVPGDEPGVKKDMVIESDTVSFNAG
jgi:hypothetical protein